MNNLNAKFERNYLVFSELEMLAIHKATVAIVGIGGVGSMAAEALARSGVGTLIILDKDNIAPSNVNRQLHALENTIGLSKVEVMGNRLKDINNEIKIIQLKQFFDETLVENFFSYKIDFVIDAIDTLSAKWLLIKESLKRDIPFVSSMGMANRLDASKLSVTTLDKTNIDPVAKQLRIFARQDKINLRKIKVVFSSEYPITQHTIINENGRTRKEKMPPASVIFTPAASGLICAQEAVKTIINRNKI